ncbi:MAG: DUF1592 domain-containing protein [Planctomycetota bacterium]|nr:DUF1592 domain-containing protein [Planctomycetota bacterium]
MQTPTQGWIRLALVALPITAVLVACGQPTTDDPVAVRAAALEYQHAVPAVLERYCLECHGAEDPEGGFSLGAYLPALVPPAAAQIRSSTAVLERLSHHVSGGLMPPEGSPPVPEAERERLTAWIATAIDRAWVEAGPDPGRVTMRRLSRYEYRNTVRDLTGVDYDPNVRFPADDVGYGFDHIGDVLTLPPVLLEKYMEAAEEITAQALVVVHADTPDVRVRRVEAEAASRSDGAALAADGVSLNSVSDVSAILAFPRAGYYLLRARVRPTQAGPDAVRVQFAVEDRVVADLQVAELTGTIVDRSVRVRMGRGQRRISVRFPNDYYQPNHPDRSQRDRNLFVDWFEIEGPEEVEQGVELDSFLPCEPKPGRESECAEAYLGPLLARAFRRPATPDELQRYVSLMLETVAAGESFEGAAQVALQAVLVAPQFLFRIEMDAPGADRSRPLNDHELASRLSYFLWSSCPDEDLAAAADLGMLRVTLHEQVARMLADARSQSLVENFAVQWLELRRLDTAAPDARRFKAFDEALRASMRRETELFVEAIITEDRSILDLIDAPFTYLNEALAAHYGIGGVQGDEFRRVDLPDARRGGLLGQASILTLTSFPHRTSPVLRGKWVLEEILGQPPPPPPPGVGTLEAQPTEFLKLSLRERLARHRADPGCAGCHDTMDNLGYGLENFNAIGGWRTRDGATTLDTRGQLPDGRTFEGPAELRRILRADPGFPHCFAEKLLTYALGRGLEPFDRPALKQITREARRGQLRFSAFVHAVVATDAFTMRRTHGESR